MKPTIIQVGEQGATVGKPTIMQPDPKGGAVGKPTVITTAVQPPAIQPTKTFVPTRLPANPLPNPAPVPRGVDHPTAITGVARKRIPVTFADLEALRLSTDVAVLTLALKRVQVTNADDLTDSLVVLWGQETQQAYGKLVSETLNFLQSPVLKKASDRMGRLLDILALIDLKKVAGFGAADNAISRLWTKTTASIDSLPELMDATREIEQITMLLNNELEALLDLKKTLEGNSRAIDEVAASIEVEAIAATYIAQYLEKSPNTEARLQAQQLVGRSMSLVQSYAQIRSSQGMRQMQIEQPLHIVNAIQHTVLVMVPAWLGSVTSLRVMLEGKRKPTVTEVGELSDQTNTIIQQLKGN